MADEIKTKTQDIKGFFEQEAVQERFEKLLGDRAYSFIASIIDIINNNERLASVEPQSLMLAAANAAALDLPINPNLGFAYIVPYKNKAQFQMGYKGFIQLAMRSGQFKTISAAPIYKGQLIEENPLAGYRFDFEAKESDEVIGYAAYFKLLYGFEKTHYMTLDHLRTHGATYSKTYKRSDGLWSTNFDAMATKTVLKLLLSWYAPMSVEMQKAITTDQAVIKEDGVEYVDNGRESLEENNKQKEADRINSWIEKAETEEQLRKVDGVINEQPTELIDKYEAKLNELQQMS